MTSNCLVEPAIENFVGRKECLTKIEELVNRAKERKGGEGEDSSSLNGLNKNVLNKLIVIRGVNGVGKSELAKYYAQNYYASNNQSDAVLWINAESAETIANSFLKIAKHFKIPIRVNKFGPGGDVQIESPGDDIVMETSQPLPSSTTTTTPENENDIMKDFPLTDENISNLLDKVYRHFAVEKKIRALYIFDNASSMKTEYPDFGLEDFLPLDFLNKDPDSSPVVLITSAKTAMKNWEYYEPIIAGAGDSVIGRRSIPLPSVEVKNFNAEETREFLQQGLGHLIQKEKEKEDEEEANKILDLIGKLAETLRNYPLALNLAVMDLCDRYKIATNTTTAPAKLSDVLESYLDEYQTNSKNPDILRSIEDAEGNDQVLVTVWETWVKNVAYPVPPNILEILNLIAFLPSDCLSVEFCHFFHKDIKLTHAILRHFKIEDAGEIREALEILEKFSIVSVQELNPQTSTDHLAFNSFIPSFEIRVHRLAKNWTNCMFSYAAHDRFHEDHLQENHDFLLKFVTYVEKNYSFFNFSVFHDSLVETITMKELDEDADVEQAIGDEEKKKNPSIYKHYTFFAISLIREAREEAYSMLQKIYQFFLHHFDADTEEYFNLVKIALVYVHHEFISNFEYDFHQYGMSKSFQFFEELDNSQVFPESPSDPLYKIQFKEFVDLVLDLSTKYIKNQLVQKLAGDILWPASRMISTMGPMVDDSTTDEFESQNRKEKMTKWVKKYHKVIQSNPPEVDINFHTWRTAATVFQIARVSNIYEADDLTKTLVATIQAHIEHMDDFDVWEYFYETTRFWDQWVTRPWENFGEWATEDLAEASRIKKNFLDWNGLNLLIQGLVWIPQNHLEDYQTTVWHFLEIIRDMAYFEDCRITMLNSLEFMKALSHVYSTQHESTSKANGENLERRIKVMVAVLLCYFAILAEPQDTEMESTPHPEQMIATSDFATKFGYIMDSMRLFESEFISISLKSLGCSTELNRILKYCSGSAGILSRFIMSKTAAESSCSPMVSLASKFEEIVNF